MHRLSGHLLHPPHVAPTIVHLPLDMHAVKSHAVVHELVLIKAGAALLAVRAFVRGLSLVLGVLQVGTWRSESRRKGLSIGPQGLAEVHCHAMVYSWEVMDSSCRAAKTQHLHDGHRECKLNFLPKN